MLSFRIKECDRGQVVIQIVKGRLSEIVTGGLERLDPSFVEDRVRYSLDLTLDVEVSAGLPLPTTRRDRTTRRGRTTRCHGTLSPAQP